MGGYTEQFWNEIGEKHARTLRVRDPVCPLTAESQARSRAAATIPASANSMIDADQTGVGAELPKERREEIESNFAKVEEQFTELVCKPCRKTRLQSSWTKKPVPAQAREIHEQLGQICFQSYLMPTFFLHTTLWDITKQIKKNPDGTMELHNEGSESYYTSRAIIFGATLMTHLADATSSFFSIGDTERKTIEEAVGIITKELIGTVGAEMTQDETTD